MDNMEGIFTKKVEEEVGFIDTLFTLTKPKLSTLVDVTEDIINFGDAEIVYTFADRFDSYVKENNLDSGVTDDVIARLSNAILPMRSSKYIFMFAQRFPNIPPERFATKVLQLGNQKIIELFADYLGMTIEEFEDRFSLPPENPTEKSA